MVTGGKGAKKASVGDILGGWMGRESVDAEGRHRSAWGRSKTNSRNTTGIVLQKKEGMEYMGWSLVAKNMRCGGCFGKKKYRPGGTSNRGGGGISIFNVARVKEGSKRNII